MFLQYVYDNMPEVQASPVETELTNFYASHEVEEHAVLVRQFLMFLANVNCSSRTIAPCSESLTEANNRLASLILIDTPLAEADANEWIMIGADDIPSNSTMTTSTRSSAPTVRPPLLAEAVTRGLVLDDLDELNF